MGANASIPERPSLVRGGGAGSGGGTAGTPSRYSQAFHNLTGSESTESVTPRDKKKKSSKLATLRKKLIRARRHSKSFDHSRAIRELTSSWTIRELNALVEEYEATIALKELAIMANLARPHANSCKEDLSALYDYKYCTDVDLIYKGVCFPAHRAILSARCAFFRDLLVRYPEYGAQVPINIKTQGVDVNMFSSLLRYLYTGEFSIEETTKFENLDVLVQLGDEFGVPNPLDYDLRTLLETGNYADAVLVFTSGGEPPDAAEAECDAAGNRTNSDLRCHKAILAARSKFFRNLLLRRARSGEEMTERALQSPTCIVLDESVIPKQYARVLLHAIYMDTVDLSHIVHSSTSTCSLSEVQAMVAGRGAATSADEAMEIYGIGQFLEFNMLSQGCEDLVADQISVDNLVMILNWSSEPHGSPWVHRQALHFLKEEFLHVMHSPVLHDLSKQYLIQAIRSDFLQAGELDVLTAAMKWGEHQLMKRMEEREPNLLSHTAHSVTKKGIKKRDLNDVELRELLAELLPYVRTDHVIPPSSDVLASGIKRGLISTPPSHMLGDDSAGASRMCAWIRSKNSGMFVKPRLFLPYYEEAKAMLEEQVCQVQENEVVRLRVVHMSPIPDTLYMVEDKASCGGAPCYPPYLPTAVSSTIDTSGTILVPDTDTLKAMKKREHSLHHTKLSQRAYSLPCADRRAISYYIQLRVVREFGLPDTTVEIMQSAHSYYLDEQLGGPEAHTVPQYRTPTRHPRASQSEPGGHTSLSSSHHALHAQGGGARGGRFPQLSSPASPPPPHTHHYHYHHHSHAHLHGTPHTSAGSPPPSLHSSPQYAVRRRSPSTPVSPIRSFSQIEKEACSDGALSDMMPDIALATSSLTQMSLQDLDLAAAHGNGGAGAGHANVPHQIAGHDLIPQHAGDLELDLGDRGGHSSGTGTLYI